MITKICFVIAVLIWLGLAIAYTVTNDRIPRTVFWLAVINLTLALVIIGFGGD